MKKEVVKFLALLMVAIGAGPAAAAVWQWSLTAASNGTADPTINWAVGMAPSAVDPSARSLVSQQRPPGPTSMPIDVPQPVGLPAAQKLAAIMQRLDQIRAVEQERLRKLAVAHPAEKNSPDAMS